VNPPGLTWAAITADGHRSVVVDLTAEDRDERIRVAVGCDDLVWLDAGKRSTLLCCEDSLVNYGGRMIGARLTQTDFGNLRCFKRLGLLDFGAMDYADVDESRVPFTHWVTFTDLAWQVAHALRREQAEAATHYLAARGAAGEVPAEGS
jgi:hypothetical protein